MGRLQGAGNLQEAVNGAHRNLLASTLRRVVQHRLPQSVRRPYPSNGWVGQTLSKPEATTKATKRKGIRAVQR